MIRPARLAIASAIALSFGCASAPVPLMSLDGGTAGGDSGGGGDDGSVGPGMATQKGKTIDFGTMAGVAGATVTLGGPSAVSMAAPMKGVYAIAVPINTPFFMTVTGPTYVKLIEQEWEISGDYDRNTTSMIDMVTEGMLEGALPGFDMTKGVLGVGITFSAGAACKDEAGATIALATPGASKVRYFKGGFPDGPTTAVLTGQNTPSAVIYNIDLGSDLTVNATPPTGCTLDTFPHTEGTITYTGKAKIEGGGATTSFFRVFVK
jgi:hypothetical protein